MKIALLIPLFLFWLSTPAIAQEELSVSTTTMFIVGEEEHLEVTEYYLLVNQSSQEYSGELSFPVPQDARHFYILSGLNTPSISSGLLKGQITLPPGEGEVLFQYELPYPYPHLVKQINYPTERFALVASRELTLSAPLLSPPVLEEIEGRGYWILTANSLKPGMLIPISISGPKGGVPDWSAPLAFSLAVLAFLAPFAYLKFRK